MVEDLGFRNLGCFLEAHGESPLSESIIQANLFKRNMPEISCSISTTFKVRSGEAAYSPPQVDRIWCLWGS